MVTTITRLIIINFYLFYSIQTQTDIPIGKLKNWLFLVNNEYLLQKNRLVR